MTSVNWTDGCEESVFLKILNFNWQRKAGKTFSLMIKPHYLTSDVCATENNKKGLLYMYFSASHGFCFAPRCTTGSGGGGPESLCIKDKWWTGQQYMSVEIVGEQIALFLQIKTTK